MSPSIDKRSSQLSRRHGGHISRAQLTELGLSKGEIDRRVQRGLLIVVFRGVYAVGRLPTTRRDQAAGALLACGPHAVLSHTSAAALWGINNQWPLPLELLSASDRRPQGLRVHLTAKLVRAEVTRHHGLRVTTPARTVLDIAPSLGTGRLTRIVNDLRLERRLTLDELRGLIKGHPRHRGTSAIAQLVAEDRGPTRSDLEDAFLRFIVRYDLPRPIVNANIGGYEVDAYFPPERVIVELDGYNVHKTRKKFESDRARDVYFLANHDTPTVRLTYLRMRHRGDQEAADLHRILEGRRKQPWYLATSDDRSIESKPQTLSATDVNRRLRSQLPEI